MVVVLVDSPVNMDVVCGGVVVGGDFQIGTTGTQNTDPCQLKHLLSFEMAPQQKSGIAVGINKGHITTRRELKQKPSQRRVCRWMDGYMDGWMDGYRDIIC